MATWQPCPYDEAYLFFDTSGISGIPLVDGDAKFSLGSCWDVAGSGILIVCFMLPSENDKLFLAPERHLDGVVSPGSVGEALEVETLAFFGDFSSVVNASLARTGWDSPEWYVKFKINKWVKSIEACHPAVEMNIKCQKQIRVISSGEPGRATNRTFFDQPNSFTEIG